MNLASKKILITGGSLGIGKAIAQLAVEKGAQVIITGRDKNRLQIAAQETGAIPFKCDIAKPDAPEQMHRFVMDKFGSLDVLINNAGIGIRASLEELTYEKFKQVYDVNVFGLSLLTAKFAPYFKEKKSGNIINIASTAALRGYQNGSIYASSKFALRGLTECWRAELRPFGVRVMLINPSEVATAFGNPDRKEREAEDNKLSSDEIAHAVIAVLEMDQRGFIPELSVWATNPF